MRKTAKMLRNGHFFLFISCLSVDLPYFKSLFTAKLLDIKRVFRDKMQKSNNKVINKIFSTLT